jgi:hypothetical protein
MAVPEKQKVDCKDFLGMINSVDADSIPEGAAVEQINIISLVGSQMATRRGYRIVTFEAE